MVLLITVQTPQHVAYYHQPNPIAWLLSPPIKNPTARSLLPPAKPHSMVIITTNQKPHSKELIITIQAPPRGAYYHPNPIAWCLLSPF
jgi:hypothetical protein